MSTHTLDGRLIRVDLGTGAWVLEQADGQRFELHGAVPAALEGKRVRVRGRPGSGLSAAMAGQPFDVQNIEPA